MPSPFATMTPLQREHAAQAAKAARETKAARMSDNLTLKILADRYPEHAGRIDAMKSGSLKAAATMMCITCSGGSRAEATKCVARGCPLFEHRPGAGDTTT